MEISPETDNEVLLITFTLSTELKSNSFWDKGRIRIAIVIDDFWLFLLFVLVIKLFFWYEGSVKNTPSLFWLSSINLDYY